VITHAHSDHAVAGCGAYLATPQTAALLRRRIGPDITIQTLEYGESLSMGGIKLSLHPAGHILGSAQVRLEHGGDVAVIGGDYKLDPDPTCAPFELVPCRSFYTETTFGLPVYRWPAVETVFADIINWWQGNADTGKASLLTAYAVGKAQRLLAGLHLSGEALPGPILCHGAITTGLIAYAEAGVELPLPENVMEVPKETLRNALVLAPPSALSGPWVRRIMPCSSAMASGWMRIRGRRRRRAVDRGFVLSDHVDWPGILQTVEACGAESVYTMHGSVEQVARYLREQGLNAQALDIDLPPAEAGDENEQAREEPSS
jgi:putative mRNA 3-end processing factor